MSTSSQHFSADELPPIFNVPLCEFYFSKQLCIQFGSYNNNLDFEGSVPCNQKLCFIQSSKFLPLLFDNIIIKNSINTCLLAFSYIHTHGKKVRKPGVASLL